MGARGMTFIRNRSGATAIEYALIASLVSIFVVGALMALGDTNNGMYVYIEDNIVPVLSGER